MLTKSEAVKLNTDSSDIIDTFSDGAYLNIAEKELRLNGPEDLCNEINKFTKKIIKYKDTKV